MQSEFNKNKFIMPTALAVLAMVIFTSWVMSYDTPRYNKFEMNRAKWENRVAQREYKRVYQATWNASRDTLDNNADYAALHKTLNKLWYTLIYSERPDTNLFKANVQRFNTLASHARLVSNRLRYEYMKSNPELIRAKQRLDASERHLAQLRRDSLAVDSIQKIPQQTRWETNWAKIKRDFPWINFNSQKQR